MPQLLLINFCIHPGCGNKARNKKPGYCSKHRARKERHGCPTIRKGNIKAQGPYCALLQVYRKPTVYWYTIINRKVIYVHRLIAEIILGKLSKAKQKKVSLLGLSFKPNTPVIIESPAIKLIHNLLKRGIEVVVYDPLAMDNTKEVFKDKIEYAKSVKDCLSRSSLWVITTPDKEFKNIDDSFVGNTPPTVIDCWRILDFHKFSKKVKYIRWGYFRENLQIKNKSKRSIQLTNKK